MECERLKKLIKNWYVQVQDESMAPARMVDFMNNHVSDCSICMADPVIEIEIKRITEIVLPPAKIPKAVRKKAPDTPQETDADAPPADDAAPNEGGKTDNNNDDTKDDMDQDEDNVDPDTEDEVDADPDEDEI